MEIGMVVNVILRTERRESGFVCLSLFLFLSFGTFCN